MQIRRGTGRESAQRKTKEHLVFRDKPSCQMAQLVEDKD
jgi:hypothetical protein